MFRRSVRFSEIYYLLDLLTLEGIGLVATEDEDLAVANNLGTLYLVTLYLVHALAKSQPLKVVYLKPEALRASLYDAWSWVMCIRSSARSRAARRTVRNLVCSAISLEVGGVVRASRTWVNLRLDALR